MDDSGNLAEKGKSTDMDVVIAPLHNADGSCELRWGPKTRILCGVTGPGDVSSSKRIFDRTNVFFSINRLPQRSKEDVRLVLSSQQQPQQPSSSTLSTTVQPSDQFIVSIVQAAVDVFAYPRTCLQICTHELGADGPTDSAQINGICLALLDAGIRMHYVFAAVTLALMGDEQGEEEFVPEPDGIQAAASKALFTFVFRPSTFLGGKLIGTHSMGQFTMEQYKKALDSAERRCLPVFDFYRRQIQLKFIYQMKTS